MDPSDIVATISALGAAEIDILDRDGLASTLRDVARARAWLDAVEVRCTRRTRALAAAGRSDPVEQMHGRHGRHSGKASTTIADRERVTEVMPGFEASLADGAVSAGHLDAIASATRRVDAAVAAEFARYEDALLTHAATDSVDTFARRCRETVRHLAAAHAGNDADELDRQRSASCVKRWVDEIDGMHKTLLSLDPQRDATMWSAVERTLRRLRAIDGNSQLPWNQMQVNAFVASTLGGVIDDAPRAASGHEPTAAVPFRSPDAAVEEEAEVERVPDGPRLDDPETIARVLRSMELRSPEVTVLIDLCTLIDGMHEHSVCELEDGCTLPVSTVRRLCCDAEIVPVVLGGDGEVLDVGRSRRTPNRAQRRALRAMHRTCIHPGCTVPFAHTKAHHVRFWGRDTGPTDIANLAPLCERHHHLVHEGRWTLTMTSERVATWTRPDGSIAHHGSTIDRRPAGRNGPVNRRRQRSTSG